MIIRAALATDDGKTLMDRHFGDGKYYDIYEITESSSKFLSRIENPNHGEEGPEVHADPEKALSISQLLKWEGVNTAVSRFFGPNIKKIRKKFVCFLPSDFFIEDVIKQIQFYNKKIESEWLSGEDREIIRINKREDSND